jgi:hypothetical protein
MIRLPLLALIALALTTLAGPPATFPKIAAENLAGETKNFPQDFPSDRTVLLIAWQREQQAELDTWMEKLQLLKDGAPAWIEFPVIEDPGAIARAVIDLGMKRGIPNPKIRARVFTLYRDPAEFARQASLPDATRVHIAVVDRRGTVHAVASGPWSAASEKTIRAVLKN